MSTDNFSPQVPSTVYLDYMEQGIAARKAEAESNASTQGEPGLSRPAGYLAPDPGSRGVVAR